LKNKPRLTAGLFYIYCLRIGYQIQVQLSQMVKVLLKINSKQLYENHGDAGVKTTKSLAEIGSALREVTGW